VKWLIAVALVIVGAYAAYQIAFPIYTHRYRLTVEVEVDGKVHSGSSVLQVSARQQPNVFPEAGALTWLNGEAVFVDLGRAGNIVAILALGPKGQDVDGPEELAIKAFNVPRPNRPLGQYIDIAGMTGQRELPRSLMPTLVTFSDLSDPRSAKVVYATETYEIRNAKGGFERMGRRVAVDAFEETFGEGVRLRRAWIELTNDPVTRGIEAKLLWLTELKLKQQRSGYFSGSGEPRVSHFTR
jgi:hypothetical protein